MSGNPRSIGDFVGARRLCVLTTAAVWLAACGGSGPAPPGRSSPTPRVLAGNGTTWQVVITAEDTPFVTGLALDGYGHIYLAEYGPARIADYSLGGTFTRNWGTHGSAAGLHQYSRTKVTPDGRGNLYVTEALYNRVEEFSAAGESLAVWGSQGSDPGQFSNPVGIQIDGLGEVYVADADNSRVQKLSSSGKPIAQWGSDGTQPGRFHYPFGLALDAKGDVYVSETGKPGDAGNDRVQEFSPTGSLIATWGAIGRNPGNLVDPTDIAVDSGGDLYVVDSGNNRIQEFSPAGQYLAQWAGPSTPAFDEHTGMAMDGKGNLYVSVQNLILRTCVVKGGCR